MNCSGYQTNVSGVSLVSADKYHPQEHGFWDYTTPTTGGMEHFKLDDYKLLLDDMHAAGMNSLAMVVKWWTTGYRSNLKFLDQEPTNNIIASDNQLLYRVFEEAAKRKIEIWLVAVVSMFPVANIKTPACIYADIPLTRSRTTKSGIYDLDSTEIQDCAVQVFEEIVSLFPQAAGLVVEIEASGKEVPNRIPLYNMWAEQNGYPQFKNLGHPLECRIPQIEPWRKYTTHRRVELSKRIEAAVRAKGYKGDMALLCETGWQNYIITQEVDIKEFARGCSNWDVVSYECAYNKTHNRNGMMEMAVEEPRKAGLKTFYLPRGVMTWVACADKWPLPISLEQSWQIDLEDIVRYQPQGVWWFGCGGLKKGSHVDPARLKKVGFSSGHETRKALLKQIAKFGNGLSAKMVKTSSNKFRKNF